MIPIPPKPQSPRIRKSVRDRAGMALVITLSLLVLVTIAAMAFFVRATANRSVETSRANHILASQVTDTAGDYVAGQFLFEIAAKSVVATNAAGPTIYRVTTNTFAVPQRPLPAGLTNINYANLVRRSVNESANGIGETAASAHSTATASKNGRVIGTDRWNAPFLLSGGGFTTTSQLPNWIYLNRDGTASATPTTNVIGRFAYNVYDIGGLLDANVAGYPTSVTGTTLAQLKSTLAGADLTAIPGITNPNTFVTWRNGPAAATDTAYVSAVTNAAKTGFLTPDANTQRFASRQDLIRFARAAQYGVNTNALPYLTTFSRTVNAPSLTPDPSRPKVLSQTPALPTQGLDDQFNPSLITTRVTVPFTRADGSPAAIGEPLLKTRFSLQRLALLESASGSVATGSDIYKFFGLTRSSATSPWIYNHGAANGILTLSEVAAAGREPDFFEILQACIPVGSLGKSLGKTSAYVTTPQVDVVRDTFPYYQILQIGANLIDQWDADSYPTAIQMLDGNNFTFSGIENLPYLGRIFSNEYRSMGDPANPTADPTREYVNYFLQPEVWNPHQNASNPPSPGAIGNDGPNEFRFVIDGSYSLVMNLAFAPQNPGDNFSENGTRGITFSSSTTNFQEPKLLDNPIGTASDPKDTVITPSGTKIVGMRMASLPAPIVLDGNGNPIIPAPIGPDTNRVVPNPSLSYLIQYRRNGQWITYGGMRFHMMRFISGPGAPSLGAYPNPIRYLIARSDPRIDRFGFLLGYNYGDPGANPNVTMRPDYTNTGAQVWDNSKSDTYPGWHPLNPNVGGWQWAYCWGLLTGNKPASSTWYADADGQNRLGDAAFSSGADGEPMQAGNLPSRPAILNRPFRSVAEMGYAGRDMPWKTLDLFTQASADSPLLDAFMLSDTGSSVIVAGAVNLNTRQTPVLQAILSGAAKTPASSLTATDAQNLASRITTITGAAPLDNKAALANTVTANEPLNLGSAADGAIKTRREVVTRALGDVGQVRTWNLLVDGVAQSGQFVGGTAAGDFLVQGEQRFWKSLAIDRPTATVISSQTETVNE